MMHDPVTKIKYSASNFGLCTTKAIDLPKRYLLFISSFLEQKIFF